MDTCDIRITGLNVRTVNAPLEFPVHTAVGTVSTSPLVLIDLHTNAGIVGHAYLFAYTPMALPALVDILKELESSLEGQQLEPYTIESNLEKKFRLIGYSGLIRMACSGIDMAVWDALSKAHGVPLSTLLGGSAKPIKAYDSHSMDGEALAVKRAALSVEDGFKAIKTKIGYASLDQDITVIRRIKQEVGDDAAIMVDYNQSLTTTEAIRRGLALDAEGVYWIEEPTFHYNYSAHADIRTKIATPIQIGENWFGPEEMFKSLTSGASDFAMPDVMKIGGVTGWTRAAALAQQFSTPVSSHLFQEISAHLLSVTPNAHWLERMDLASSVVEPTLTFKEGFAIPSDQPGIGISWKESEIKKLS
ncbi:MULTISPECIES: enolase C-terminal domain-like protein [Halomonadaceae]|uniref:Mandelate racemase n=1 Tax=Vreelandella glaciei TaxID=186761 RepID=A0A7Z0LQ41_9GAMM|nr:MULTISPECIES: enolase C-terminal domain-like protein [Halomonas]NYS76511.1 mandelate racemase [Halomonas glaciei]|tara:strand:- start:2925 stop:4007 length:1083 start_codon:yes stop_codon:yes gene_type:complete